MDVNTESGWTQREFTNLSVDCEHKNGVLCNKTDVACKDYLCPIVLSADSIVEVRSNFAQQQKRVRFAH